MKSLTLLTTSTTILNLFRNMGGETLTPLKEPGDSPSQPDAALLIQLHAAEYQALTARATYFITIMAGIWPLMILYLAVVAQVVKSSNASFSESLKVILSTPTFVRAAFVWGNLFVLQLMLLIYSQFLLEQYGIVLYLETGIRPLLRRLVGDAQFWRYEEFQKQLSRKISTYWEPTCPVAVGIVLLVILWFLRPMTMIDWLGFGLNFLVFFCLGWITFRIIQTRRQWYRSYAQVTILAK
jgi:hypothetical protein